MSFLDASQKRDKLMKFLTLNTHSWMEEDAEGKFQTLKKQILKAQYDIICFQEVNQEIETSVVDTDAYYHALPSATPIHQDHFVRLLVEKLAEEGLQYHWTWAYNHIGYDHLNEGVAVLSRQPLTASEILVSDVDDPTDYHTRRVAVAETTVDGREVAVASVHLSWWDKTASATDTNSGSVLAIRHPVSGCLRMMSHSASVRAPGFLKILSSMHSFPISQTAASNSRSSM